MYNLAQRMGRLVSMLTGSLQRITIGVVIAVPMAALTVGLLVRLPEWLIFAVAMVGLVLFYAGAAFDVGFSSRTRSWLTGLGGILMLSGILAWAMLQASLV